MSHQLRKRYDIIVSGGGIVGFTLLNLFAKSPFLGKQSVLVLEHSSKPSSFKQPARIRQETGGNEWSHSESSEDISRHFSNRVSSITNSSRRLFDRVGAWTTISDYVKQVRKIKVWNYNYSQKIIFDSVAIDDSDLVFSVVENNRLLLALLNNLSSKRSDFHDIAWQCSLKDLKRDTSSGLVEVIYENQGVECSASAPLILGCDGYGSKVRKLAGIDLTEKTIDKTAVVGTVEVLTTDDRESNDVAYQRFSSEKDTVAALLPLDKSHSSFVISAPSTYALHLMNCDKEAFVNEFNQLLSENENPSGSLLQLAHEATNTVLDTFDSTVKYSDSSSQSTFGTNIQDYPQVLSLLDESRASFPLKYGVALRSMVAPLGGSGDIQVALLGDSAHRVHPLAGQGLNMGIADAEELVKQLEVYARCGERIFNEKDLSILNDVLRRYDLKRRSNVIPMMAAISQMQTLFELTPTSLITLFNRMSPLKTSLVKLANGC